VTKPKIAVTGSSAPFSWSAAGQTVLRNWTTIVVNRPRLTLLIAGLLTVLLAIYTFNTLGLSTNTEDMIDDNLQWRQDFNKLRSQFPRQYRAIAIVVDAETDDLLTLAYRDDPSSVPAAFEQRLIKAMQLNDSGEYPLLDWSRLNSIEDTPARRLLFVNVVLEQNKPRPAEKILTALREHGKATAAAFDNRVQVRLSGTIALEDDELVTVNENSKSTALLALVSVCLILLLAFRSWRLLLISVVTLLTGLVRRLAFLLLHPPHLSECRSLG